MCPVIGEYAANRITGIDGDPALVRAFKIPDRRTLTRRHRRKPATPSDSTEAATQATIEKERRRFRRREWPQ